jgi:hypothetical protein
MGLQRVSDGTLTPALLPSQGLVLYPRPTRQEQATCLHGNPCSLDPDYDESADARCRPALAPHGGAAMAGSVIPRALAAAIR